MFPNGFNKGPYTGSPKIRDTFLGVSIIIRIIVYYSLGMDDLVVAYSRA